MRKRVLIYKVEKWHPHLEKLLHMFPVQVIGVNLRMSLMKKLLKTMKRASYKVFLQTVTGSEHPKPLIFLRYNHSLLALSLQTMCVFFLS